MGKKVAILTINDYSNYGNRLQNYALQEVVKSLGYNVETIINERSNLSLQSTRTLSEKIKSFLEVPNGKKISFIKLKINSYLNKQYRIKKIKAFKEFTLKYIKETEFSISQNRIPKDLASKYDFFITGSDQVWNPVYGFGTSIDFITFAPKNKRIAYAPSFGISKLPSDYIEKFKVWLSEMGYLSVREEVGAQIINDLIGKDVSVLVDPTLMIDKEQWLSIASKDLAKPSNKYLLTYFLGEIPKRQLRAIKTIALENDLEIVNLADDRDKKRYAIDPSEFIDYIYSSELFLTNSFHGAVFSILLEKPFIVLNRAGMNSRIDTLLSKFRLENRKWENCKNNNDIFSIDFSHISAILEYERNKAKTYLLNALV